MLVAVPLRASGGGGGDDIADVGQRQRSLVCSGGSGLVDIC